MVHTPWSQVSVWPTAGVPEIEGRVVFTTLMKKRLTYTSTETHARCGMPPMSTRPPGAAAWWDSFLRPAPTPSQPPVWLGLRTRTVRSEPGALPGKSAWLKATYGTPAIAAMRGPAASYPTSLTDPGPLSHVVPV